MAETRHKRGKAIIIIKDTYTLLINYLLLSQLLRGAVLPMRARLRLLATSTLVLAAYAITTSTLHVIRHAIKIGRVKGRRSRRLLLLEVGKGCKDVLRGRTILASVGIFRISAEGSSPGGGRCRLLVDQVRLHQDDLLLDLLELLQEQVLLEVITSSSSSAAATDSLRHNVGLCLRIVGHSVVVHVVFCRVLVVLQMLLVHFPYWFGSQ